MNVSIVLIGQGSMLFLLLYALFSNVTTRNMDRVIRIMKRSAIFAVLCVLSDGIAMVIAFVAVPQNAWLLTLCAT